MDLELVKQYAHLYRGFTDAYGSGAGGWIKKPLDLGAFRHHLEGKGPGIGVGPLMPDGKCAFAAIDLDRPDFTAAKDLMEMLPGQSWLERSRSGNAHVLVFFSDPIDAWIPRGVLQAALDAAGEKAVEVFPKNDRLREGMFGNYLNLSYHGDERPIIASCPGSMENIYSYVTDGHTEADTPGMTLGSFVSNANEHMNDPEKWTKRAQLLKVKSPEAKSADRAQFGQSPNLHKCAAYIIEHRDDQPIMEGHRNAVFFTLAKCLTNWSEVDHDEAWMYMNLVNDASPDRVPANDLLRILSNAERGEYTSFGCDDPLVRPYRDPTCTIGD